MSTPPPPSLPRKLWTPSPTQGLLARAFISHLNTQHSLTLSTWTDLHTFSVTHRSAFYSALFTLHPIIHSLLPSPSSLSPLPIISSTSRMDSLPPWFPTVLTNLAENVLYSPSPSNPSVRSTFRKEDWRVACIEVREGGVERRECTWGELRARVDDMAAAMRAKGVRKGDRVAVVASNSIDTLVVMMGVTALGGIFSSSSTDMGTSGVLQRLRQIRPKWVFVDDWALYNGRRFELRGKMEEILKGMEGVEELKGLVSVPRTKGAPRDVGGMGRVETLEEFLRAGEGREKGGFERVGFNDPAVIVYSSGTTGMPKCIVHNVGGLVLDAKKEGNLHRDAAAIDPDDLCTLQYTTTGWIMYMASPSALVNGSRVVLYDGSPFQPDLKMFVKLAGELGVTDLGISPRYLQTLASAKPPVLPREVADLSRLRRVVSTGMVLSEAQFEWFYDAAFPPNVQLANISGGTDVAACFTMDNLMQPLYVGGCMSAALGMKIEAYDQTVEGGRGVVGRPLPVGESGEMVCTLGFPTQPVMFWGDETGERYFSSYYERFDNVWTHGDFISIHPVTGQVFLHGRADGVLNPSGVRFGSAEIYNVIDTRFPDEVQDSICVGQRRPQDDDESVMLFLLMKPGKKFTQKLVKSVKEAIATDCGRRCVPKYVFETPEIPTTINLKKVELPVKHIVSGKTVKPSDTLANKDCLKFYYQFAKVEDLLQPRSKL